MAIASSDRIIFRRKTTVESAWGETPASPACTLFPVTSGIVNHGKSTVLSQTLDPGRMTPDIIQTGFGADGSFNFELSYGDFDWAFESLFGSTFSSTTFTGSSDISFAADPYNNITGAGVDITGLSVGQHIKVSGTSSNNDVFKITGLNTNWIAVDGPLVTENNTSATIAGSMLRMGTQQLSYFIEQEFNDITQFKYVTGARISQMSISFSSRAIITGSFNFIAKQAFRDTTTQSSGTDSAVSANPIMNASTSVGSVKEAGTTLSTGLRSVNFTVNGNLRGQEQIGSSALTQIADGTFAVEGTVDAYFEDAVLYNKALNHTTTSLSFRLTDDDSNIYVMTLPAIKLSGDPNPQGQNQDIAFQLQMQAFKDTTTSTMMQIDRFAA